MRLLVEREWMLFVDGENFAKRGQELLADAGCLPEHGPHWERDVYLWAAGETSGWWSLSGFRPEVYGFLATRSNYERSPRPPRKQPGRLRRAYYYTSTRSGEPEWTNVRVAIRNLGFEPRLFKRKPNGRSKAVDISLATDVLTQGASGQYQVAVIVAGDGDYVPLVEAVKRLGLHVGVAFVENGLNPELRISADEYLDLGEPLIASWRGHFRAKAEAEAKATEATEPDGHATAQRNHD